MKKITFVLLLVAFFLLFNLKTNALPICEWAQKIACSNQAPVICVETDNLENIYVVGWFYSSTVEFNNGISLENYNNYDSYIAKYNSEGICQWAQRIYGGFDVFLLGLEVDNNNNVYISGQSMSSILYFNNGISLTSNSFKQGFIAKYNSDGICQWAQFVSDDSSATQAFRMKADSDGNIILIGEFYASTIHFNNNITLNSNGQHNGFIAKYNPDGICQWAQSISGDSTNLFRDLGIDNNNNVYALGQFMSDTAFFNNDKFLVNSEKYNPDGFLAKYNSDGICQWVEKIGGTNIDYTWYLAVENLEANNQVLNSSEYLLQNIYISGRSKSDKLDFNNNISLMGNGVEEAFIAKYNSDGICQWADRVIGCGNFSALTIAVDNKRNVYFSDEFYGNTVYFNNGISLVNSSLPGNHRDLFFAKYNSDGICQWAERISGDLCEENLGIAADNNGNLYIVGDSQSNTLIFNNGISLPLKGMWDGYLVKYSTEATSIEDNISNTLFSVFPNPVKDIATINCNYQNSDNLKLTITNLIGEIVKEVHLFSSTNSHVNLSELSSGIYIFTISGNSFSESKIVSVIK